MSARNFLLGGLEKQRASIAGETFCWEDWKSSVRVWPDSVRDECEKLFAGRTGKAACEYGRRNFLLGGLEKQRASMAGKEDWSWQRTGVGEKLFAGKTGKAACEYGRAKDWSWMEVCRTKGAEKNA